MKKGFFVLALFLCINAQAEDLGAALVSRCNLESKASIVNCIYLLIEDQLGGPDVVLPALMQSFSDLRSDLESAGESIEQEANLQDLADGIAEVVRPTMLPAIDPSQATFDDLRVGHVQLLGDAGE